MVGVVRIKDVSIKGVREEDWDFLIKFGTTYRLTMPEIVEILVDVLRERTQHAIPTIQ